MTHKTVDADAVLALWDNGEVVAEFDDDETTAHIAKSLNVTESDVRNVLVSSGRIEEA